MDLSPQGLWLAMGVPAKLIFLVLLLMLIWSVYVGIERIFTFTRARGQSRMLAAAIAKPLSTGDMEGSLKVVNDPAYKLAYLGSVIRAGLSEYKARPDHHGIEAARRGLERVAITEAANLKKGMKIGRAHV